MINVKKRLIFLMISVVIVALLVCLSTQPLAGIQLMQTYPWKGGMEGIVNGIGYGYVSSDGKWLEIQNDNKIAPQYSIYSTVFPYRKINISLPTPPNNYAYTVSPWYANAWSPQGNNLFVVMALWGPLIRMNRYCVIHIEANEQVDTNCYDLPEDYYGFSWATMGDKGLIYAVLDDGTLLLKVIDNKGIIIEEVTLPQLAHSPSKGKHQTMWVSWDGSIVNFAQYYFDRQGQGKTGHTNNIEVYSIPLEHPEENELIYTEGFPEGYGGHGVESQDPESGNILMLGNNQGSPEFLIMDPKTKTIIREIAITPPEGTIMNIGQSHCLFACRKTAWEVSIQSGSSNKNYVLVWSWEDESFHFMKRGDIRGKIKSLDGFLCSRDIYGPFLRNPLQLYSICR